jgi:hypothetical protein
MTAPLPRDPGDGGSPLRLVIASVLLVVAFAVAVIAFAWLIDVLEHGGYGTPPMRNALLLLGMSGAALAGGIATMIWDIAKRYENR